MNATLLCLAMLVPGYGEKDILKRIDAEGGTVYSGGVLVELASNTTDADLRDLCELHRLVALNLSNTKVTDEGLRVVSGLRKLTVLELQGIRFTDVGLLHLETMSNLRRLDLRLCPNVTAEGVARLRKALQKCEIWR
jgi:hypothetical protein